MLRSRSLDDLPSSGNTAEEDAGWSDDATRRAMLEIIQSDGTPSMPTNRAYLGSMRGQMGQEMWSYGESAPGNYTDRTIFNIGHIATPGRAVPFKPSRSGTQSNITFNVDTKKEKDYISRCNLPPYTRGPFNNMIMQTFYKAPKPESSENGMPKPFNREGNMHQHVIKSMKMKTQNYIKIKHHRTLCTPDPCPCHEGHSEQYCDILGPGSCSRCIENTNRHIANVIQKKMFPSIEVTNNCLVVPKLSKVLKEGHIKEVRMKRLQELNLPKSLMGPRRQTQPITWNTLHPKSSSSKISTCGSLPSVSVSFGSTFSLQSICLDA